MTIQDIMTKPAVTCRVSDTLDIAARLMWENDCGAIPVTNDTGDVAGMITDRDVCMSAYTQGSPLHTIPVYLAMSKRAFTCQPTDTLDTAERLMREKQVRRLPVVDRANRAVGVVSLNDIARHAASPRQHQAHDHEVAQTLAAIGQPRG